MRNLKKILALVLALMMTLSLMVTASASSYSDAGKIDAAYNEAVEVLTGMGVYRGNDKGEFLPDTTLNRKDAAALVYRVISGDVDDVYVKNFAGYAEQFTDVSANAWYAPYVGFAVNGGYIKGDGKGHFNPDAPITGTEVLTILLRAVGYDQNGEFSNNWPLTVATLAKELGVTDTVTGVSLTKAVSREVVAELIFKTLTKAYTVKYTPAFGYQPIYTSASVNGSSGKVTLGQKVFGLTDEGRQTIDKWGRPGHVWTYNTGDEETVVAEAALATYTTKVTECKITDDANGGKDMDDLLVWINANKMGYTYDVQAADVVTKLGAQGRLTEVYYDRIVMIDTMLAQVTDVTDAKYDVAGHQTAPATMTLKVFDRDTSVTSTVVLSSKTNYTYSKGAMILVNLHTANSDAVGTNTLFGGHGSADKTAYKLLGVADSITGAQTVIYYNANQHTVDGNTYQDANCFHLDQAGKDTTNHIWYFDQYKNLIGAVDIATVYSYGTIDTIQWINPQSANGYALATLVLMDGSKLSDVTVKAIGDEADTTAPTALKYAAEGTRAVSLKDGYVSTTLQENVAEFHGNHLYRIEKNANGSYTLWAVGSTSVPGARLGTDVTVSSKVAVVSKGSANASTDAASYIVMDSATQYLIQSSKGAFTTVAGFNNIESYTNATVDYVDVNKDGRVDYVFIVGDPDSAQTSGLFYVADEKVDYSYDTATGIYTINGIFNGVPGSIKVNSAITNYTFAGINSASASVTGAQAFVDKLLAHANTYHGLYDVDIVNGYVVAADAVDNAKTDLGDTANYAGPYTGLDGIRYYNKVGYYADDVLSIQGKDFNVTTATKFIINGVSYTKAELDNGVTFNNATIHVVYSAGDYATEVYVYVPSSGSNTPNPTNSYALTGYTFDSAKGTKITVVSNVDLTANRPVVTVFNALGQQVYTDTATVTATGSGTYTLSLGHTLTAGNSYYAVITFADGTVRTTPMVEAQTSV